MGGRNSGDKKAVARTEDGKEAGSGSALEQSLLRPFKPSV